MLEYIDTKQIETIARSAGTYIMEIYAKDFDVEYKDDKSPLTEADKGANAIIEKDLAALEESIGQKIPILSEEGKSIPFEKRRGWDYFWMVDPLDGTKEFIKKNGEFTVNIALIHEGKPILGVVYAPAIDVMYSAKQGEGAYRNGKKLPLFVNEAPEKSLKIVASKSHLSDETKAYIDEIAKGSETIDLVSKGSSLKLCMVAEGSADIYPRLAPTMEWDTAAAHAVVLESGKQVIDFETGTPIVYNKENLLNPWFVVKGCEE